MNMEIFIITAIIKSIIVQSIQSSIYMHIQYTQSQVQSKQQLQSTYTCIHTTILLHVLTLQYIYKNTSRNSELSKQC
jgi:hypothetical protein